jgi:two-component system sensor histidine kinase UhpB
LNTNQSTALFRIIQEALTNIILHAKADQVVITIGIDRHILLLCISDNGCGINPQLQHKTVGYGIQGMQERTRHFGGVLTISSPAGRGVVLNLSMPILVKEFEKPHD